MKKLMLLALLLAQIPGTAPRAGTGVWTPVGISGGQVLDVEYVGPGVALATTPHAIWRTTNHGASWTFVRSIALASQDASIAVNPANNLQVVINADVLWQSSDGGQSFNSVALNNVFGGVFGVTAFSHDGTYAFFAGSSGDVWRSTDGGANWSRLAGVLPAQLYFYVDTDVADRDTVYASAGGKLYRSRDAAATWVQLTTPRSFFSVHASRSTSGRLLMEDSQGIVPSISTDFGATWSSQAAPTSIFSFGTASGGRAITGGASQTHVFTSADDGATWNDRGRLPNAGASRFSFDPVDPQHILAATATGVIGSDDGGASWAERNSGIADANAYDIAVARDGSNALYVAAGDINSVYRRDAGSGAYTGVARQSTPLLGYPGAPQPYSGFRIATTPSSGNTLYMARDTFVGRSVDGGVTWSKLADLEFVRGIAVDASDPQVLYVNAAFNFRSVNGGASWSQLPSTVPTAVKQFLVDPSNGANVYAIIDDGGGASVPAYKSVDSGQHFTPTPWSGGHPFYSYAIAIDPAQPATLYLATNQGLFKSTNSAGSWTLLNAYPGFQTTPIADVIVDPQNSAVVYAAHSGNEPARSVDGGNTWTMLAPTSGAPIYPFKKLALMPGRNATLVGLRLDGGVYEFDVSPVLSVTTTGTSLIATQSSTLALSISNDGTPAATRVRVTGALPAALGSYAVQSTGGTCTVTTRDLACDVGTLRPAAAATISVVFTPLATADFDISIGAYEPLASSGSISRSFSVLPAPPGSGSSSGGGSSGGGGNDGGGGGGGRVDYLLLAVLGLVLHLRRRTALVARGLGSRKR